MKRRLVITVLSLCLIPSILSALNHDVDRTRPRFFEGTLSVRPVPLVGQQATMSLELTAIAGDCENATIQFRTPAGVALLGSGVFERQHLTRGVTCRYFADIEVMQEGDYALQATAYFQLLDGQRRAEHFFIYLTAGRTNSRARHDAPFFTTKRKLRMETRMKGLAAPSRQVTIGRAAISGHITYYDDNLAQQVPIRSIMVELLEKGEQGSQLIDSVYTDDDGYYSFEDVDTLDPDGARRDVQLRVSFDNDILKITDSEDVIYRFESFTTYNVPDGQMNIDYSLDSRNQHRGIGHIFNCVMDAHDLLQDRANWRRAKMKVKWPCGEWSRYGYSYNKLLGAIFKEYIQLAAGQEWNRTTILHEYGHAVMTGMYGYREDYLPPISPRDGQHYVYTVSDTGFAITEGWAEFFEALVDDNAYNLTAYANANAPNIESNGWWTGSGDGEGNNTRGEIVEGSVASILWDIVDTDRSRDGSPGSDDDDMDGMFEELWDVMINHRPISILDFWDHWVEGSYGGTRALYSIYGTHGVDVTPPWDVFTSGPWVCDVTSTSAVVVWSTNEASTSAVKYGAKPEYGLTAKGACSVTEHSVFLDSLSQDTIYYYRVGSDDANGSAVWSEQKTFKTRPEVVNRTSSIEPAGIKGDVNGDGMILCNDAILALRIVTGLTEPTDGQRWAADMNGDGKVGADDAVLIIYKAAGLAAPGGAMREQGDTVAKLAASGQVTVALGEAYSATGESVIVPLELSNAAQLAGGDIRVAYDPSILRAVDVSAGPASGAGGGVPLLASNTVGPEEVRIAFVRSGGAVPILDGLDSGVLVEIRFRRARTRAWAHGGVPLHGVSAVALKMVELYGPNALPMSSIRVDKRVWAMPPEESALLQNFPNPFNPHTWIPYQLREGSEVTIQIFSVSGGLVRELYLGYKPAGLYTDRDRAAYWDGRNELGQKVASGIYFYRIKAGDFAFVRKLVLLATAAQVSEHRTLAPLHRAQQSCPAEDVEQDMPLDFGTTGLLGHCA